jgi:hypothetical protein
MSRSAALAAAVLCAAGGTAAAQSAATPRTDLDAKPGTLSDKLGQTGGVIKPTGNVDPAMRKTAPQTGTMPVVKPGQVPPQSGTGAGGGKGGFK